MNVISELSNDMEMALTSKWQAVVGDEFDIIVSETFGLVGQLCRLSFKSALSVIIIFKHKLQTYIFTPAFKQH